MNRRERREARRQDRQEAAARSEYGRYRCACEWGRGKIAEQGISIRGLDFLGMVFGVFNGLRESIRRGEATSLPFFMDDADGVVQNGLICATEVGNPNGPDMIAANLYALAQARSATKVAVGLTCMDQSGTTLLVIDAWERGVHWGICLPSDEIWSAKQDIGEDLEALAMALQTNRPAVFIPDVFSEELAVSA